MVHLGTQAEKNPKVLDRTPDGEDEAQLIALLKQTLKSEPKKWTNIAKNIKGVSEETTTGVHRLYQMHERGELKVPMVNLGREAYTIQPGERVAQLCIAPVYTAAFVPAEELGDTQRGDTVRRQAVQLVTVEAD